LWAGPVNLALGHHRRALVAQRTSRARLLSVEYEDVMQIHKLIIAAALLSSAIALPLQAATVARWKFEEGAGSAFIAGAGARNNGALINQASFSTDSRSSTRSTFSVAFDGANDVAVVPDSPSLRVQSALTVEAWIKPNPGARVIIGKQLGNSCCVNSYQIELNPFRFQLTDTSSQDHIIGASSDPSPNVWHHVAATWDGSTMRLYLDRVEVGSGPFSGTIGYDANPLLIGGEDDGAGIPGCCLFTGLIDDVRI
jgi:hypothetical protein